MATMSRNRGVASCCGVLVLMCLTACSDSDDGSVQPVPRIDVLEIGQTQQGGLRELPARIEAAQRAELSFRVPGKLQQIAIGEGDLVEAGQILAQLAQEDFRTELADKKAVFQRTSADYKRAQQLIGDGYITRREFDLIETRYRQAKAAYERAKVNLGYTVLKAPFTGKVAKRYVENFEEVTRGQPVFALRSVDMLDVKMSVPESMVILVTEEDRSDENREESLTVQFSARPELEFPLRFKEVARKADPKTRTFEVTYMMDQPTEINVLPGMTATVTIDIPKLRGLVYQVPQRAVIGDIHMAAQVWVLDEASMTVSLRPVQIGKMMGGDIEILQGLDAGDKLVISPSNFLLEGQTVQYRTADEPAGSV